MGPTRPKDQLAKVLKKGMIYIPCSEGSTNEGERKVKKQKKKKKMKKTKKEERGLEL
jgi:hypothetical protein